MVNSQPAAGAEWRPTYLDDALRAVDLEADRGADARFLEVLLAARLRAGRLAADRFAADRFAADRFWAADVFVADRFAADRFAADRFAVGRFFGADFDRGGLA